MPLWHAGGQEFESPWLHSTEAQPLAGFFYCQCAALTLLDPLVGTKAAATGEKIEDAPQALGTDLAGEGVWASEAS